jgi:hypothetical protein
MVQHVSLERTGRVARRRTAAAQTRPTTLAGASCIVANIMSRGLRALAVATAFVLLGAPGRAAADERSTYLAEQLRTNDDYRVRTQAALALGGSDTDDAVRPLCDALADTNVSVRVAAAAALGKLARPAGIPCLKQAETTEAAPSAKAQIQKSVGALEAASAASGPPPPPASDAKFYVALQVTNKSTRPSRDVEDMVRAAMQGKLLASRGYAVAPKEETSAQALQIIQGKKLKGYYLLATVEPPVYAGEELTQIVRVSMWSYPDRALQGELSPSFTQSSARMGDTKSEDALVRLCVERAIELFQKITATM